MIGLLIGAFLCGLGLGALSTLLILHLDPRPDRSRRLPPATRRQIERAARATRLDTPTPDRRRFIPPAADFDDEDMTR